MFIELFDDAPPPIFFLLLCNPFLRLLGTTFLEVVAQLFYFEEERDRDYNFPDLNFSDFLSGSLYRLFTEPLVL